NHHFGYVFLESGLRIEVHWDLIPPYHGIHVDINKVWKRSCPSMISGIAVRELAPDDLLLYLSVHAAKHVFDRGLRTVYDIAETLQYFENKIDWQRLQQTAQEWCAMRCLHVELWLADELFFAPIPDNVMNAIKLQNLEPSYQVLIKECLFAIGETSETSRITPNKAYALTKKNIPGKVGHLLWRLFPSRQFMALKYGAPPDSLRFMLFYPLRLKDIMKRHYWTVWRFVRRDARMVAAVKRQSRVSELKEWLFPG
ncbi:MAG: nucleotidyltransferase family protein, partial [Planctomycetes bacterium]|nr:nucleotidyltransferase family protein [Planctomycetota bacterium]